jgi:hypothetical protein
MSKLSSKPCRICLERLRSRPSRPRDANCVGRWLGVQQRELGFDIASPFLHWRQDFSESMSHLFYLLGAGLESNSDSVGPLSVIDERQYGEAHILLTHRRVMPHDIVSDEVAERTADDDIGRKVSPSSNATGADCGCETVGAQLGRPCRIFGGNNARQSPRGGCMAGGEGTRHSVAAWPVGPKAARSRALIGDVPGRLPASGYRILTKR